MEQNEAHGGSAAIRSQGQFLMGPLKPGVYIYTYDNIQALGALEYDDVLETVI